MPLPFSYQSTVELIARAANNITGTSINTPTTVASAARHIILGARSELAKSVVDMI